MTFRMGRIFDVVAAAAGMVVLSPLFAAAAVGIKLQDGGPILYRAPRVGLNGRPIQIYKFRTMRENAAASGPAITAKGDARITPMGRILRRTKIDELPQLFNVLKGDMSIVGPRPEDPRYVRLYTPEQRRVLDVRPGITSAASVRYRDEQELLEGDDWESTYRTIIMPEKLALDLEYMERRSTLSDLKIIWQTVTALFR